MSSDVVLSVRNVSKRYEIYDKPSRRLWQMLCAGHHNFYREFWALKDVSFDVHRGESIGIIGRNGAGKSTILKVITGTLQATQGKVERYGKIAALLELGSGFNPEFTGRENVFLNASILGLSRKETEAHYQEIIDFADIGDFIDQPVKKYSSGMKVRLAFAVQVMVKPDILIVDEALAVGDMFFQQKCMARMRRLREEGTTLLFVSHSLGAVRSLCEKAIYLERGRLKLMGIAKDVCDAYSMSVAGGQCESAAPKNAVAVEVRPKALSRDEDLSEPSLPFRIDAAFPKRVTSRSGSGDIRYVSLDFYDDRGVRIGEVESGQRVRLVASFIAMKDVPPDMALGFGCRDRFGNQLISLNNHTLGAQLPALRAKARRTVEYAFRVPLNAGQYFWSVGAQPGPDSERFYDYCLGAAALTVVKAPTDFSKYQWGRLLFRPDRVRLTGCGTQWRIFP